MSLLPVYQNNKLGFVNVFGQIVIQPTFDVSSAIDLNLFFQGDNLAVVSLNGKRGVINEFGNFVIQPMYDDFLLKIGNRWYTKFLGEVGILDYVGDIFTRIPYEVVSFFGEGLMAVRLAGKWGYVNEDWNLVIKPQFDAALLFDGGVAPVKAGSLWKHINKNGLLKEV